MRIGRVHLLSETALRKLVAIAFLSLLAGCTDADWAHVMSYGTDAKYPDDAPRAAVNYAANTGAPVASSVARNCERTAADRSSDVEAQGYDEALQHEVHDRVYADCMTWAARSAR